MVPSCEATSNFSGNIENTHKLPTGADVPIDQPLRYTLIGMGFLEFLAIVVILIAGRSPTRERSGSGSGSGIFTTKDLWSGSFGDAPSGIMARLDLKIPFKS